MLLIRKLILIKKMQNLDIFKASLQFKNEKKIHTVPIVPPPPNIHTHKTLDTVLGKSIQFRYEVGRFGKRKVEESKKNKLAAMAKTKRKECFQYF